MQEYLITCKEVGAMARDMSSHIDEERVNTYIRESEMIDLKSALGDALFLDVKDNPEKYDKLLNGGEYEVCGEKRIFSGLKRTLAYYTYARVVKNGNGNVTRYGFVNKESEYSSNAEFKERNMAYNDAFSIADRLMKECLRYLIDIKEPLYKGGGKMKANRTIYRIIGE